MNYLFIFIGIVLVGYFILYMVYRIAFLRSEKPSSLFTIKFTKEQEKKKNMILKELVSYYKKDFEEVYIDSFDGLKLYGKYYHLDDKKPIVICFHGYKGNIYDNQIGIKKICFENDFNILMVNQRSHGKSEGKSISFGINERRDVQFWVNYVAKRFPKNKIILAGTSMGGASVLMASDLSLSSNVCGIVADCPFSSPLDVVKGYLVKKRIPIKLGLNLVCMSALLIGRFDLKSHDSLSSIKKSKIDILLIHSEEDSVVSCDNSRNLHDKSRNNTTLEVFTGADHGVSYLSDSERYTKVFLDFVKRVTK